MKTNQIGRSMVEMLGVLAIIGVLSVGAIAGYSKAMMKYKINKTIDEISNIVANIRTVFNGNYEGLDSYNNPNILKNLNIVPENMWQGTELVNAFGGKVIYGNIIDAFYIEYQGLSSDICVRLATQGWAIDGGFLVVGACGDVYKFCDYASVTEAYWGQESFSYTDDAELEEVYAPYWEGTMSLERAKLGCACEGNSCTVMLGYK